MIGDDAHAIREHVILKAFAPRAALPAKVFAE
jgi:hypothetical protein